MSEPLYVCFDLEAATQGYPLTLMEGFNIAALPDGKQVCYTHVMTAEQLEEAREKRKIDVIAEVEETPDCSHWVSDVRYKAYIEASNFDPVVLARLAKRIEPTPAVYSA